MDEVEYHCGGCGEYFEAAAGGADCWQCGSSDTSQLSEK
jgi:DNA-directed RNA polymerase subunit RPC12/RpoP